MMIDKEMMERARKIASEFKDPEGIITTPSVSYFQRKLQISYIRATEIHYALYAKKQTNGDRNSEQKVYTCNCQTPLYKAASEMYKELEKVKAWLERNAGNMAYYNPPSVVNMLEAAEEIETLLKKARGEE